MATADSKHRVRKHRERLRKSGLRPIEIWVPDVNAPGFAAEAHRQSALIAASPDDEEDQAWIDDVTRGIWDDE